MKRIAILTSALLLSSCSQTGGIVVLQNPKTGEVQQCTSNPELLNADKFVNQCAAAYESIGWKRVSATSTRP
jgi:hypothetical protein